MCKKLNLFFSKFDLIPIMTSQSFQVIQNTFLPPPTSPQEASKFCAPALIGAWGRHLPHFLYPVGKPPTHTCLCSQAMFGGESHICLALDTLGPPADLSIETHLLPLLLSLWSLPCDGGKELGRGSGTSPLSQSPPGNELACPWIPRLIWGFSQTLDLVQGQGKAKAAAAAPSFLHQLGEPVGALGGMEWGMGEGE